MLTLLILNMVCSCLSKLILINCFLLFLRNLVCVCERVFPITVAVTLTKPGWTKGRPIRLKSLVPATRTFSSLISSPIAGGHSPTRTMRSPSVTRLCFPITWTIAKLLLSFESARVLTVFITLDALSFSSFVTTTLVELNLGRTAAGRSD